MTTQYTLFSTCPRGLESILSEEIAHQGGSNIQAHDGGVSFQGSLTTVYQVNLHARTASRVLLQLSKGNYRSEQDIYKLAKNIKWHQWFNSSNTIKVKVEGKRAQVKSLDFIALKIKDAVCDAFREHSGERPSVDKIRPDVRIHAFINDKTIQIFLDSSGEALFKRGYRHNTGEAPLRENLAAGMLLLAGYNGKQAFQDPFCGSGTLAIEAAWIAINHAPGLMRSFGFERWLPFNKAEWVALKQAARQAILPRPPHRIAASDNDRHMTRIAQDNARMAQVDGFIEFTTQDAQDTRPPSADGIMVSNPPYGVRLAEIQTLHALYPQLGTWLKQHYAGWSIGLLSGDRDICKLMRLSPKRKIPLFNGNLDCRLFLLDMVRGSNRQK